MGQPHVANTAQFVEIEPLQLRQCSQHGQARIPNLG